MGADDIGLTIGDNPVLFEDTLDGWPDNLAASIERVDADQFILRLRGTETVLTLQFRLPVGKKIDVNDGAKK